MIEDTKKTRWATADKLRANIDAAENKHIVLDLIFVKYISDTFQTRRDMASGAKFRNGYTLLTRITPCLENGKITFVDFLGEDQIGWGATGFLVLRPKKPRPEYFGYLLCRRPSLQYYAIQSMSGTSGHQLVQNDVLSHYLLAVSNEGVASAFSGVVESVQKSITANHAMARNLTTLRDTLLPSLISGQLHLNDRFPVLKEAA